MKENNLTARVFFRKVCFKMTKNINEKKLSRIRGKKLKNKDFTMISNNCFAGWVYRIYNLPYLTPTVGLFIMPKDYIKFVNNLKHYMCIKLEFIKPEESKYKEDISARDERFGKYPIGLLEDIEIHFLHYKTKEEAEEKWERRKKRINWNNIIIKFSEQNGATKEDIENFCNIKEYVNKICFVARDVSKMDGTIQVKEFRKCGYMVDDMWYATKYIKLTKYLNGTKDK